MNNNIPLISAISVLIGVLCKALIDWIKTKNNEERVNIKIVVSELRLQLEDLRKERIRDQTKCDIELQQLREQLTLMAMRVTFIESNSSDSDWCIPIWCRSADGRFVSANPEFIKTFISPSGKSIESVIGYSNEKLWPENLHSVFAELDNKSKEGPFYVAFKQGIEIQGHKYTIIKTVRFSGNTQIGWRSLAIRETKGDI